MSAKPPPQLTAVEFQPHMIASAMVRDFDCGEKEWESEVSDWLKSETGGPINDIQLGGCKVWLFLNDENLLVGVGAIGPHNTSYPTEKSPKIKTCCITNLGVDHRHQRKGYGQVILDHLLAEAKETYGSIPIVAYVHKENITAMDWYVKKNNFVSFGKLVKNRYQKIALDLSRITTQSE